MEQHSRLKSFSLGIFSLSFSILLFEIVLVRIISVVSLASVAFFAITLTLFGVAVGGLIVYGCANHFREEVLQRRLVQYCTLYGISLVLFPILYLRLPFFQYGTFTVVGALLFSAPPFIFGNIAIASLFMQKSNAIKLLYFSDLLGAGIGVVAAVLLLQVITGPSAVFAAAAFALLAAFFFGGGIRGLRIKTLGGVFASTLLIILNQYFGFASVHQTQNFSGDTVVFSKWNSFSRVSLHDYGFDDPALPPFARHKGIRIDSDAYTPVLPFDGDTAEKEQYRRFLGSAVYEVAHPGHALIIGPGGGQEVISAVLNGFTVRGVEINPIIVNDILRGRLREFSGGIYDRPDVEITIAEGRSFLERDTGLYDVIQLTMVDTWAATASGNLSLAESFLYTVEAFEAYVGHLRPEGILSMTRWDVDGIRLLSLFFEAAESAGIENPENHIVILSNEENPKRVFSNFLFKKSPFTEQEIAKVREYVAAVPSMTLTYSPFDGGDNSFYHYIAAEEKAAFQQQYPKKISPVYDNNPFYFFITPLSDLFGQETILRIDGGLTLLLTIALLLSIVILLLPLVFFPRAMGTVAKRNALLHIGYFGTIGLAFLLLEIALIQQFILYLEQPVYSYSVILASLLVFAGFGSLWSRRLNSLNVRNYFFITGIIGASVLLLVFVLRPLVDQTIGLPLFLKIVLSVLFTVPISFVMGMMLPMAVQRLNLLYRQELIPWGWAANGAMSVLASVLAVLFGILFGIREVILIAAGLYLIAPFFVLATRNEGAMRVDEGDPSSGENSPEV